MNTTQLLRFRDAQGRLSASAGALGSVGVDVSRLGASRASEIALDDIAGLRYTYNAAMQTVNWWCRTRCAVLSKWIRGACPRPARHLGARSDPEL